MTATSVDLSAIKTDALSAASTFRTLIGLGSSAVLNAGSANGVATLGADSKLTAAQIPDISLISYLGSVASQAAMLALTGQQGDWCVRSDLSTTWVITGSDPTQIGSWTQLSYPSVPVQSVFGRTGAVVGVSTDYSAVGIDSTAIGAVTPSSGAFTSLTTSAHKITVGTITVGRGGQTSISTCLAVGFESLNSSSLSGIQNTAVGYRSLTATTSGNNNNAFGASSLIANTTGVRNCAYGAGSLLNNTSGSKNIAIGHLAGSNIDIGSSNVCVGDAVSADVGSDSYQINIGNRYYHNRLRFGDTTPTYDAILLRDAANTLAMQNGANAQRFNLYGTYSDGANYRRLYLDSTTAGAFKIGVEGAGAGASGNTLTVDFSYSVQLARIEDNGGGINIRCGAGNYAYQFFQNEFMPAVSGQLNLGSEQYSRQWGFVYANRFRADGLSLTGSQATSLFDATATWNTTGTPTAFKLNVTDTASNAASNFAAFQFAGVSRYEFAKTAFRLYNTNDASTANYERAKIAWSSNVLQIGTEKLGTGAARALELQTDGTTRASIPTTGGLVVGTAALATNATSGFLYVPTCAGTPSGTPASQTGTAPIVIDTTNNKLYFYSGGAWRDAGP